MSHPDDSEFAQGDLTGPALTAVESHLAACAACRAVVAHLVKVLSPPMAAVSPPTRPCATSGAPGLEALELAVLAHDDAH